jgi:hypothetical protein
MTQQDAKRWFPLDQDTSMNRSDESEEKEEDANTSVNSSILSQWERNGVEDSPAQALNFDSTESPPTATEERQTNLTEQLNRDLNEIAPIPSPAQSRNRRRRSSITATSPNRPSPKFQQGTADDAEDDSDNDMDMTLTGDYSQVAQSALQQLRLPEQSSANADDSDRTVELGSLSSLVAEDESMSPSDAKSPQLPEKSSANADDSDRTVELGSLSGLVAEDESMSPATAGVSEASVSPSTSLAFDISADSSVIENDTSANNMSALSNAVSMTYSTDDSVRESLGSCSTSVQDSPGSSPVAASSTHALSPQAAESSPVIHISSPELSGDENGLLGSSRRPIATRRDRPIGGSSDASDGISEGINDGGEGGVSDLDITFGSASNSICVAGDASDADTTQNASISNANSDHEDDYDDNLLRKEESEEVPFNTSN